jgi:hypothetical protein
MVFTLSKNNPYSIIPMQFILKNKMSENKNNKIDNDKASKTSTLNFVEVSEIRDGVILLRDGSMRSVISVSSANFALKSNQEQENIIGIFQGVLNSLSFSIQILIQSRKLDLNPYIQKLKQMEDKQTNDLLRIKMQEYIEYIQQMVREVNIMNKEFYVIIGYDNVDIKQGVFGSFLRSFNPNITMRQSQEDFVKNKKLLMSRVDQVSSRMVGLDLQVNMLDTEQLIALMYNSYNPDASESIRLGKIAKLDIIS